MSDDTKIEIKKFNDYPDCENEVLFEFEYNNLIEMKLINTETLPATSYPLGSGGADKNAKIITKTFIDSNNQFHVRTYLV